MSVPALVPSFFNLPSIQTRKALLLLDFQNDFVRSNGHLPVRNTQDFIDQIPALVQSFRHNGDVVWVRTLYEEPRPVVDPYYGGERIIISAGSLDSKTPTKGKGNGGRGESPVDVVDPEAFLSGPNPACQPQTSGVQFPAPILAAIDHENDIVIEKSDYSALQSPGLVLSLRSRFVTELYICGSLSNVSVFATALDAAQQGFSITLVEDCMGFRSFARHEEAVRRLADIVGANGISIQELLEDQDWQETQEIANSDAPQRPESSQKSRTPTPAGIEGVLDHLAVQNSPPASHPSPKMERHDRPDSRNVPPVSVAHSSIEIEADDNIDDDDDEMPVVLPPSKYLRASTRGLRESRTQGGANPARMRRSKTDRHSPSSSRRPASSAAESAPRRTSTSPVITSSRPPVPGSPSPSALKPSASAPPTSSPASGHAKRKNKTANDIVGPRDRIAEGDSRIIYNMDLPLDSFAEIRDEVNWQKMYHMSGQVPRLVAVQGAVLPDKSIPIYRHPADESPILEPFTPTVDTVRVCAEKALGHPLNHVLIQLYRDGQDRISEHSDKTLDIVRGSFIVNVSLGAQRTMTLRTKTSAVTEADDDTGGRQKQQVPMPHESMFVLGPLSNMRWLHGIRADKRPASEKSEDEKAFDGERISLTFRHIGTFINPELQSIWGQGAVSKQSNSPRRIIHADAAEAEKLIQAFGRENRETEFDWDAVYGHGFDVVNFVEPAVARVTLSGDPIADMRVRLCLTENGMRYEVAPATDNTNAHQTTYTSPDGRTVIAGDIQILTFMASLSPDSPVARPGVDFVRGGCRLQEITKLGTAWRKHLLNTRSSTEFEQLSSWNDQLRDAELAHGHHYIAGPLFTIDDITLWSILYQIQERRGIILGSTEYQHLSSYYQRIEKRGCVRVVLDEVSSEKKQAD